MDDRLKLSIMEMVDECEYNLRSFKDITNGVTIVSPNGDGQRKYINQERADIATLLGHAYKLIIDYRAHKKELEEIEAQKLSGEGVVKNTLNEFDALIGCSHNAIQVEDTDNHQHQDDLVVQQIQPRGAP